MQGQDHIYAVNITFFESDHTAVFLREQGQRLVELALQIEEAVRTGSSGS